MKKKLSAMVLIVMLVAVLMPNAALADTYTSTIQDIHSSFRLGNSSASSAVQQSVNGLYRMVELLELITLELD